MADRKQELIDDVEAARREVLDAVDGLTPDQWERPTTNPGWSAKDTLAHLASIESRLRQMFGLVLSGASWPADAPDLDTYNAACVAERRVWAPAQVVAELRSSGAETRQLLGGLAPADLDRRWTHPTRGEVTLASLVEIIPRHLREHGREIRAAVRG
jgi:uncharacterized protein (TIGR03083 family)